MKKLLAGAALAAILATPAFAADAIMAPEPSPTPVAEAPAGFDWSGFIIGAQVGWGWANADVPGASYDADGVIGGVHAGYNYDFGQWVAGVEADYDFTDLGFDGLPDSSVDGVARLKGKIGADLGRALLYGTAGGAYAHGKVLGDNKDDFGYVVGAGIDFAATDNIIVGAEYLYHGFDNFDDTGADINAHTFTLRAGYKF